MSKRRTQHSDDYLFGSEDDPIGLTGAFVPVKGPQSVDYDSDDDPVGLTQAFGAVVPDEAERPWSDEGKWSGFDWNAGYDGADDEGSGEEAAEEPEGQPVAEPEPEPDAEPEGAPAVPLESDAAEPAAPAGPAAPGSTSSKASGRGRHAAPSPVMTPRMKRSRRVRHILIALLVLAIVLIGVVGFFAFRTISESQQEAAQRAQEQTDEPSAEAMEDTVGNDANETAVAQADVPNLTSLLGKTSDEAVEALQRGALVTSNQEATDKKSAVKTNLTVSLTEEPGSSKVGGTPTVYLGLDKKGKIIQVGYSASASALGFGSLSFADAVESEHVVEKTLAKIGVEVAEGTAVLPEDRSTYATFASDGTTVRTERCSFEGPVDVDGKACTWSSVLSYDYTAQLVSGDLSKTVRIIYVYVSQNVDPEPEPSKSAASPNPDQPAA